MEGNFFDWMSAKADLMTESIPGTTLVEISGDRRVLIECHGGVTTYGQKEICVKVSYGTICVQGTGLELVRMTKQQLVICGGIDCISLVRGKG